MEKDISAPNQVNKKKSISMPTEETGNTITSLGELSQKRDALQLEINQAQREIDEAKANLQKTGVYADASWFAERKTFIRDATVELHCLNRKIKSVKIAVNRSSPRATFFQEAARQILDEGTYNQIMAAAKDLSRVAL